MGYKEVDIRVPVHIQQSEIKSYIRKKVSIKDFSYSILLKSLDARNKKKICWQFRVGIRSDEIKGGVEPFPKQLEIPKSKTNLSVVVVGSGPAGIFSAKVLAEAGCKVTLIERGSPVLERKKAIQNFETTGQLDPINNYAFGEGGAGTFSDGKLTSRTKGISGEKNYIFSSFIDAGAPKEILYMTHPHLGSDNLLQVTQNLRQQFLNLGGEILFGTMLQKINCTGNKVVSIETNRGVLEAETFVLAIGHSAYETYTMLIHQGVEFQVKNFAVGMRAEHPQELINTAQWGVPKLPNVKAAEYRLTTKDSGNKAIYSFCMCPGGIVVPATAYENANIVNGMSLYLRNNQWANAAVVTGLHPDEMLNGKATPLSALKWLEKLEQSFYTFSKSYAAPAVLINDFLNDKVTSRFPSSSYPFDLLSADMSTLLPNRIINSLKEGLKSFSHKLRGYESGLLIGLESKTSSPVQVVRGNNLQATYKNLFIVGEGSGWAGGIVSSAADGIKASISILNNG